MDVLLTLNQFALPILHCGQYTCTNLFANVCSFIARGSNDYGL